MKWSKLRVVTAGVGACVVVLSMGAQADAGWGSYGSYGSGGGSYGSSGGYMSSGGSSGSWGSSGGSYGSWGSHGGWASHGSSGGWGSSGGGLFARLHARIHAHHARHYASWGSSGGSYGSYGSSGGSYSRYDMYSSYGGGYSSGGSYGSSGGSYGSSGGVIYKGGTVMEGQVVPEAAPAAEAPAVGDQTSRAGRATLLVSVPAEARIFVNGVQTKSTGTSRSYVSRGLRPGLNYAYVVRAEIERDGKLVEETKTANLRAGQDVALSFSLSGDEPATSVTTLKLTVPEDAKVFLAGNQTSSTGAIREFTTTKLAAGQSWDPYTIRVTVERDGQSVTQEKTIVLAAGDNQSLTFDFESPQVASAR